MRRQGSARKKVTSYSDAGLKSAEILELVHNGGSGLVERIGLSGRTLRRRLAKAGTTLHELKRGARRRLAATLLASSLPLGEVAERLGYSSTQVLARFVKAEFGMTATAIRHGH